MDRYNLAKKYQEPAENIMMDIGTLAKSKTDLIDLSIGDPDLDTDKRIIDQAFADAKDGHTHYTASDGSTAFIQAVIDHYKNLYHLDFAPSQVRATVGAMHGMYLTLLAILDPGDEVIIHEPYFPPYKEQIELAGGVPVTVPTYEKDGFQLEEDKLKQAITKKTKAVIINSPNNPTGAVFSKETFEKIADIAIAQDLFILSDEIYEALVFNDHFTPMATFAPENTITFSGFSKSFAMTGWRIGYMIAPTYISETAKLINENITYSAPSISQQAGIYALNHANELIPEVTGVFKERLEYVKKRVDAINFLHLGEVEGTMYAFINVADTQLDATTFSKRLLDEAKVLVVPGNAFGTTVGSKHVRLAVTQKMSVLKEAFDRIEQMSIETT
ncbi:aspartate aminotransferase [Tetragenococcus osmophilus]|uniref:Aminotransferase n=1 Tax=Tetragenococcus osmophilus TaxID=526944 RepID=A0AA38CUC7_9ENTE|nr:pyridoxal phosphate-dependent aminotransferase [Tetragenococcus osmophilus]AYW48638.1 aspartate aminotransferase [Tetragenococcus osmophilus]GMA54569.1 aminotransferase [Alicyclobacillus contaminans]GMA71588.1 aminotransferase [Tetragenococcus osmophilus]